MKSNITFVNVGKIKKSVDTDSKQQDPKDRSSDLVSPRISFSALTTVSEDSYIVGGLSTKIRNSLLSWWSCDNESITKVIKATNWNTIIKNLLVCGNSFVEIIRNGAWDIIKILPVTQTNTIMVLKWGGGYVQQIHASDTYFNKFTPIEDRAKQVSIRQANGSRVNELILNDKNQCGYNPNLNELYQFKLDSISSSYYGDSFFASAITQICLLKAIDTYYEKFFDNATVTNFILSTKWGNPMSQEDKQNLQTYITTQMKGLDNAFNTAILDVELQKIWLGTDIDTKAFLDYRAKLEQSIALALNVPYDLVSSTSSNKASSATAIEQFNTYTIAPFQQYVVNGLQIIFQDMQWFDTINLAFLDTKDEKVEMETLTWYKNSGIMTVNEVRKKLWLDPIEWGDTISTTTTNTIDPLPQPVTKSSNNLYSTIRKINESVWQYYGWCNHNQWVCGHTH